jgi:coenzyme F420-reducing hydrogenase delta subunit
MVRRRLIEKLYFHITAMAKNQELNELRKSVMNALERFGTCNDDIDTPDTEDVVATVGDTVEVVVNPDTPEAEVIEGELVGVLEDENVIDENGDVDDAERIVLVRTKNGRVRKAKIPATVKVKNARKMNKFTVKTGNTKEGIDAMRTGDTYKPPVDDGLKISKNTRNATLDEKVDLAIQEGAKKALDKIGIKNENSDDVTVSEDEAQDLVAAVQELVETVEQAFGAVDDIDDIEDYDDDGMSEIENKRYVRRAVRRSANARNTRRTRFTRNEDVEVSEGEAQALVEAVQELSDKVEQMLGTEVDDVDADETVIEVVSDGKPVEVIGNKKVTDKAPVKAGKTKNAEDKKDAKTEQTKNSSAIVQTKNSAHDMLDTMLSIANLSTVPVMTHATQFQGVVVAAEPSVEYDMIAPSVLNDLASGK